MEVIDNEGPKKWDDMGLKENVLRGIYAYGFETPSEIQQRAILPIMSGKDVIAQAQSGSGKTGSFTIASLECIDTSLSETQVLVLSPTHELVRQTANVMSDIGNCMDGLHVKTMVGGTSIRDDVNEIRKHVPHVVIGSVGRVLDMLNKRHLYGDKIRMLILDEADEMLSQGFSEKIRIMFQDYFPYEMQVVLFSATMPLEIVKMSERFMNKPVHLLMKTEDLTLQCIQQYFIPVQNDREKYEMLGRLYGEMSISKSIIYCNSVRRVMNLFDAMTQDGFSVCCIHSNMDKRERERVFAQFRNGDTRIMISSDITARGIDVQQVSTVINFDLTRNVHTYLHRIGRGGRWGRKGTAVNFLTEQDVPDIRKIEKYYQISLEKYSFQKG